MRKSWDCRTVIAEIREAFKDKIPEDVRYYVVAILRHCTFCSWVDLIQTIFELNSMCSYFSVLNFLWHVEKNWFLQSCVRIKN